MAELDELLRPLTAIEKARFAEACQGAFLAEGHMMARRLVLQADRGDDAITILARLCEPSEAVVETATDAAVAARHEWLVKTKDIGGFTPSETSVLFDEIRAVLRAAVEAAEREAATDDA